MKRCLSLFVLTCSAAVFLKAQNDTMLFSPLGQFDFPAGRSVFKPLFDRNGAPVIYSACKEEGLITFDISNTSNPVPADTISVSSFNNLKPTYIQQQGSLLYAALGDFQGSGQNPGLAVIDVANPLQPVLLGQWDSTAWNFGVSSVTVNGNYAYVCAMEDGLIILDISNPQSVQFVSHFLPDTLFGNPPYSPAARHCTYRNDTLLLAFDAGGLRMLDVSVPSSPTEIGKFVDPAIYAVAAPAYNEVVWLGDLAYVTVDYCGWEVIDVSVPASMTQVAWINPWNCFGFSWLGSDGHANQLMYVSSVQMFMLSAGDSEIKVFDGTTPAQPYITGTWGPPNDNSGAWGLDVYGNLVVLGRIDNPGINPFAADTGGIKILQWQYLMSSETIIADQEISTFPNPATGHIDVIRKNMKGDAHWQLVEISGRLIGEGASTAQQFRIDLQEVSAGYYTLIIIEEDSVTSLPLIRQ